jgi:hypothetical protein
MHRQKDIIFPTSSQSQASWLADYDTFLKVILFSRNSLQAAWPLPLLSGLYWKSTNPPTVRPQHNTLRPVVGVQGHIWHHYFFWLSSEYGGNCCQDFASRPVAIRVLQVTECLGCPIQNWREDIDSGFVRASIIKQIGIDSWGVKWDVWVAIALQELENALIECRIIRFVVV